MYLVIERPCSHTDSFDRMNEPTKRILLWSAARFMSNAFLRAMVNRPGTKGFREPFFDAYYNGSERMTTRFEHEPFKERATYADCRAICEQEYPDHDLVFVKDFAYYMRGHMDLEHGIPRHFQHTFIIRNPEKAIYSLYRASVDKDYIKRGWSFDPSEAGYEELLQMHEIVTEQLGQESIIIDADDLLEDPETYLKLYCKKLGISFHEQMLNWSEEPQYMDILYVKPDYADWVETTKRHNTFTKPTHKKPDLTELPDLVQQTIAENMVYYQKLYELRLKPETM